MTRITLFNHLWFLVPPLLWNILFTASLPIIYSSENAPNWILIAENISRAAVMIYPFFLPINARHPHFKLGRYVYILGLLIYFGSWLYIMGFSEQVLSSRPLILLAPAATPLIWLAGISLMARSRVYLLLAIIFTALHTGAYVFRFWY